MNVMAQISDALRKFEPSHSFIMAMKWDSIKKGKSFERQDPLLLKYLKGETLPIDGEKGYIGLGVENYPLGWGKLEENGLKNLYPKGWRKNR